MSDKDPAMKNITEVDSGFMVRKHVNGKRHQLFFGNAAYGSRDQALAAAMHARDELVSSLKEKRVSMAIYFDPLLANKIDPPMYV
jgi:hypothetical protein